MKNRAAPLYILALVMCAGAAVTPQVGQNEFVIKPPYTKAPELTVRDGVPKGILHEFVMKSEDSKIYPGMPRAAGGVTPYERPVAVYVPAQYKSGAPAPFIVVQDGANPKYHDILPTILDNLISEK